MDIGNDADIFRLKQRLVDAVKCTLSFYQTNMWPLLVCHPEQNSALLLLGICNSCELSLLEKDERLQKRVDELMQGILSIKLENGSFLY